MSTVYQKQKLRKIIQQRKKTLSKAEREEESVNVFYELEKTAVFQKATHILAYWSLFDELHTHYFINKWCNNKRIYLPKVVGDQVEVVPYLGIKSMKKGAFGILEPQGIALSTLHEIDLVIVPGVAFTKDGNRMGRGGGYYDRLLPLLTKATMVGVCYKCQIFDIIPVEEHDIKMDIVLFDGKSY